MTHVSIKHTSKFRGGAQELLLSKATYGDLFKMRVDSVKLGARHFTHWLETNPQNFYFSG
jgi:hypothetical protein